MTPDVVEPSHHRQEAGLVRGDLQVGGAEEERLVALVGAAVEQVGGLGVRARDDDARHPHDVELEAGGVEALDLFVRRDQNLAALMAALLRAGALVLDVVARHTGLDEAPNQVADVRIPAVTGVGVGDDEGPVVVGRRRGSLRVVHAQPQVLLIAVGGQQRPHQACGLVGHLAQRVTREIGSRILADGALRRSRPATEVDAFDSHALHHHGLPRRVRAESGDALLLGEQFTQAGIKGLRGLARHGVVRSDRPALLCDLPGRIEADDSFEARGVEVSLRSGDVLLKRCAGLCIRFDDGHGFTLRSAWFPLTVPGRTATSPDNTALVSPTMA